MASKDINPQLRQDHRPGRTLRRRPRGPGPEPPGQKRTANGRWSPRTWSQRLRINGKLTSVGLGPFPIVTLAEARVKALDNALRVAHGTDIRKPRPTTPTLAAAFEAVIAARAPSWKGAHTKRAWHLSLRYCEKISALPVSEVTATHVLQVLAPLWQKKPKMGREVRSNLGTVMEWSILSGYRTTNPSSSSSCPLPG